MKLIALTSNWNLEGIWNKNPQFYQSPVSSYLCTQSTNKSTLNHSDNTHKRKSAILAMYKIMTITKM